MTHMASLLELQKNWEGLAQTNPLWSICTDPKKRDELWNLKEFFETGKGEVEKVLEHVRSLGVTLDKTGPVLDFGCGVGRLTRALASHFPECWGVDISPTMIRMAQGFNKDCERCHFCLNQTSSLTVFRDEYFGFIYTSIVFQHIERKYVEDYLLELIRALRPGGVFVFQIPDHFKAGSIEKLRHKLRLRSKLARLLKRQHDVFLMDMHCIPENDIRKLLSSHKVRIVDIQRTNSTDPSFNGNLQYLDHDPDRSYISKQYCLIKSS
jgi:ubiquinone/menaquinone biosynthesis C-methylase UbiE